MMRMAAMRMARRVRVRPLRVKAVVFMPLHPLEVDLWASMFCFACVVVAFLFRDLGDCFCEDVYAFTAVYSEVGFPLFVYEDFYWGFVFVLPVPFVLGLGLGLGHLITHRNIFMIIPILTQYRSILILFG